MAEEKEFKTLTQIVSTEGDEKNRNITPVNPSSGFLEEIKRRNYENLSVY